MARHKTSRFEETHGVHCGEFAAAECVSPEAIRMRLKNFGTVFQRRAKPTKYEIKYGRTLYEIAEERNLHPITIVHHEVTHSDAYFTNPTGRGGSPSSHGNWRDAVQSGRYWRKQVAWMHPAHPEYENWRSGKMFPETHLGGSVLTSAEVEKMMREFGWEKY